MIEFIAFLVTFLSCIIGTICGMGGGIIVKPVLDATGVMSVSSITFLSGCTVIAMTCWSLGKTFLNKESVVELKTTTVLAIGAATGGLIGKQLFTMVASLFADRNTAGGVQAIILCLLTFATLIYTMNKDRLPSKQVTSKLVALILGLLLGVLGSFLGIGGGPFNVAVLCYFFSMPTKKATQNSLFIVLFCQVVSTLKTVVSPAGIPEISLWMLLGMMLFGIVGSEVGRRINKKIDNRQATKLLEAVMVLVMCINVYNIYIYLIK